MTDEQFDTFLKRALDELQSKQSRLSATYGLGEWKDFWFDQESAKLRFKDEAGMVRVEAIVTPIGSYSSKSNTWKWCWANESILEPLRAKSLAVKELYDLTGIDIFKASIFQADEQMAWEVTAMSVMQLGALGCYRVPGAPSELFLAINSIEAVR